MFGFEDIVNGIVEVWCLIMWGNCDCLLICCDWNFRFIVGDGCLKKFYFGGFVCVNKGWYRNIVVNEGIIMFVCFLKKMFLMLYFFNKVGLYC